MPGFTLRRFVTVESTDAREANDRLEREGEGSGNFGHPLTYDGGRELTCDCQFTPAMLTDWQDMLRGLHVTFIESDRMDSGRHKKLVEDRGRTRE